MAAPKVLLFDLGGVLVDATGLRELPPLLAEPMHPQDVRQKWVSSHAVGRFETGRCSKDEFATKFTEEWGLSLEPHDFIARFRSWVGAPYPGTGELLSALSDRHMLACLSNTNAVHWEKLLRMDGLRLVLERPFVSHELGVMKPSPAVYAHVVRELGCEPGEIAFFDDGQENVDGAARAGLSAHLTVGPQHLRQVLGDLGLL
jgi:putative hydrolase of the HAD superfamily